MRSYKTFRERLKFGLELIVSNLGSDLTSAVRTLLICSTTWKNASGALGWSDGGGKERDCAWKGEAPVVLFCNSCGLV